MRKTKYVGNETNSSESHTHVCFVILPAISVWTGFKLDSEEATNPKAPHPPAKSKPDSVLKLL